MTARASTTVARLIGESRALLVAKRQARLRAERLAFHWAALWLQRRLRRQP